jgi:hypothetical protein
MATRNESGLPISNNEDRDTSNLLPRYYRTDSNKKFLSATLDQLTQPGIAKKVNGYIGRRNAKSVVGSDIFLSATDSDRQNYQLEPVSVIQDYLGNTTFYKDYIDHINHIKVAGGNVDNHERMNKQEFYSWNPHICFDKFVNFQQYYWLPYGPSPIEVQGQQREIESTYTVTIEDEGDNYVYVFSPDGLTRSPTLTLYRGQTYNFVIDSKNNPLSIKTIRVAGDLERQTEGVSAHSVEVGTITFKVPENSPDVLFYVSEVDANTGGVFEIKDITENSFLDLNLDIIGKKTYTMNNGISLTNGMKLYFSGNVTPEKYSKDYWYVEGVGTAIKLIAEKDLEIINPYSQEISLLFDDEPFDKSPFSTVSSFPREKDYIIINRASPDRSAWSRYNRWFHQDVIISAAAASGTIPQLDQAQRATRPIIEFEAGLKLYNFGHATKKNIDLIDTFTTDVFSTVEGSLGYNVDGTSLSHGMRIIFTADQDRFVKDKIFNVNFITVTDPGRQIEFNAFTGVDITNNVITCLAPHGLSTGSQLVYLDNGNANLSGLTNRKIYYVLVLNDSQVRLFTDKALAVAVDIFAVGNGTHKFETFAGLKRQINLVEADDALPIDNETILVINGGLYQGKQFWYTGNSWKLGQQKLTINQPPLFDIFDENKISYGDTAVYDGSNFTGTKIFSYKVGTGTSDTVLGFPLTYQNISNTGDIVFEFNLLNDSFTYKNNVTVFDKKTDIGFLKIVYNLTTAVYKNGWELTKLSNTQPVVRIYKESGLVNNFPIDVYDFKDQLDDLEVKVYINGKRLNREKFSVVEGRVRKHVNLINDVTANDIVTLKCHAAQKKNKNGYYEIPLSLQNNPLNVNITQFTLGEVIDHVDSIVENLITFSGTYPGHSNLKDLGSIVEYGTRFVQHSGPMNLSLYHLGSTNANLLKGLDQARKDYGKFKRAFITFAAESGIDTDPRRHVDFILEQLSKDKTKTQPYYLSDMFSHSGANRLEYVVLDNRVKIYPLTKIFNLDNLSNQAVNIYLNDVQLVYGKDYTFGNDVFFEILTDLQEGDILEAFEYDSTDGSFCPATPAKLGLYPAFEPKIYIDDTYLTPTKVIQGHDGSITLAFNDFRDDLILELEKRIFNNIKVKYDTTIFDIYDFIPGYTRNTDYSKQEFNQVLSQFFFDWTVNIPQDYTKQNNDLWSRINPFTWNYRDNYSPDDQNLPAFWRGVYKWTLDTDRPHTHPWECLGFSIEPKWWQQIYGPAPYTKDNYILWDDIKNGNIRQPGQPIRTNLKFAKSILTFGVPVDENGNLIDPYNAGYVRGPIKETTEGYYEFGDVGPVEATWRKSSYYAFALIHTALLLKSNYTLATCLDRSRIVRNLTNQLVYKDTSLRIQLSTIQIPSTVLSSSRTFSSGLINYVVDYITHDTTLLVSQYANDLKTLTNKIGSKLGGFTGKTKFKLLLDSKNVASSGGVFIPDEDYEIVLNTSSPIKKVVYSGVVITKYSDGYELRGYNVDHPYFIYHPYTLAGRTINIGGISESYLLWTEDRYYTVGKLIKANNQYYRVKISHQSSNTFDQTYFSKLSELPVIGGRDATLKKSWNTDIELTIGYGTKLTKIQDVVDFLQGYGAYLENQGFVFDEFNNNLKNVDNWETAVKEFLFWTTQNWAVGAAISLSPAANNLLLKSNNSVVNDIQDRFFEYKVFRVDGQTLESANTKTFRNKTDFILSPYNTTHGIYGASLYLVQKEHVLLLNNNTLFNDVIYDQAPGYRQERIKVIGYMSTNWTGGYNIPGFIYDDAKILEWQQWTDYNIGDIIKYKEFYYSAQTFLPGTDSFVTSSWVRFDKKPQSRLLPNWEYKTMQFSDFYSLDSDNFDAGQQKMAQHLIGYQKRQYLENIIQDDVSQYKFYQGMIIEKGTQNVFNKLFDVLSADDTESLTFNEEWAVRVGNYGATDSYAEIEFILDESKFKLNPQPFELVSEIDPTVLDFVYRQLPTDVYIKPIDYTNNLWPTTGTNRYLRSPGYVRYDDIRLQLDTLSDIVNYDISSFNEGEYVWCAFEGRDWNIYRFTKSNFKIESINYSGTTLTITTDKLSNITTGDILGISNSSTLKGFYKVDSVINRKLYITATIANWADPFTEIDEVVLYQFLSTRVPTIDDINSVIPYNFSSNELVWVDSDLNGRYTVFKNTPVFSKITLDTFDAANNLKFGKTVALSKNGQTAIIATDNNIIYVYTKSTTDKLWIASDSIIPNLTYSSNTDIGFGDEITFSTDSKFVAISSPAASNVNQSAFTRQGYVEIYAQLSVSLIEPYNLITSQSPATNENFGKKIVFAKTSAGQYILAISAPGHNGGRGRVYFYKYTGTAWDVFTTPITGASSGINFAADIAFSENGSIFAVSAPLANNSSGVVYIYKLNGTNFQLYKTINSSTVFYNQDGSVSSEAASILTGDQFGSSLAITAGSEYIIVGSPYADNKKLNAGKVFILSNASGFNVHQILFSPKQELSERYGMSVSLMNFDKKLMIFSASGDSKNVATFDKFVIETTFDNNTLHIADRYIDSGRIDIYDRYSKKYVYGESLSVDANTDVTDNYGYSFAGNASEIIVSAPLYDDEFNNQGKVFAYHRESNTITSWIKYRVENLRPNAYKIKKAFIYNRKTNKLVKYLDIVDATQGKIPGPADQEISYKTFYDPAIYSVGIDAVNVDDGMNWVKDYEGMLWWDLTRAKFIDNQVGEIVYRSVNWNLLYDSASIDIYEWVESKYLPSAWDALYGTEKGNTLGITGRTRYGDSAYSIKKKYDSVSQTFQNTYYYWVKNPTIAPNVAGRKLSAYSVSKLISDPAGEGYPCIALTGSNSFNLINVANLLENDHCNLTVQYWKVDLEYSETNAHSQWKILSEHPNTVIPPEIEKKWIHSLVGKDDAGRLVPDISLPFKQRYGIENRPRQSMFINRVEALKEYIERVNSVLSTRLIVDDYDLTDLEKLDPAPSKLSGLWDINIDTDAELRFVGTATVSQAVLNPIIEDGRIVDVEIANAGSGYINAPFINIQGIGKDAVIKTKINNAGQIIGINLINTGQGYLDNTILTVRPFAILVTSDSNTFNRWSTYQWNSIRLEWERIKGQSYNVTKFWDYIDWYATGYNQFTKIDYIVDNTYQLSMLDSNIGNIVKVNNIGAGGWLLLEKFNNLATIDYTQNYTVIGRNNGTIKFLDNLYNYQKTGYDGELFDSTSYDNLAEIETKIIINTIKDKILVDEFRVDYLKLFFASIRYVFQEQTLVDWAMKTSFVKATHNVGNLKEKVNYNSDNLENFEDYVKEVKPYRTQIREYVSSYKKLDYARSSVTDFDLTPVINSTFDVLPLQVNIDSSGSVDTVFNEINLYPWKHWYDHVGFSVISISLIDGGSGYFENPVVRIDGGYGTGAKAKTYISNGKVSRIELLSNGTGYLKSPTVVIDGGRTVDGIQARASVVIESEVVRANKISIKFDRITRNYFISEITETETFVGTGSRIQFPLKWSPETTIGTHIVKVNNVDVLRDEYKLTTKTSTAKGFTSYSGLLTLNSAPEVGDSINITYKKNFNHLSAADRVNFYYNPESGMYGKDLAQLMTGIDYGGVNITGLGFGISGGWDSLPWFTDSWDGFDAAFDDYIVIAGTGNYTYTLPYTPAVDEEINVYVNGTRIDDLFFEDYNGVTIQPNGRKIAPEGTAMQTIIGDGVTDTFTIPAITVNGDKVIFRKSTSDGSFSPLPGEYDTQLSGGNLTYTTATGIAPDDIILEGDGFVTPMTSHAPEEIVPGQVTDALAIKVFQLPTSASAKIEFTSYISDGVTLTFKLKQIPNNFASIFVKIANLMLKQTVDYTVNWKEQTVTLMNAIPDGEIINIISLGAASYNLLDANYFVSDGVTTEYITDASWLTSGIGSTILVNGEAVQYGLFNTSDSYDSPSKIGIRFGQAPTVDSIITYILTNDQNQTASIIKTESIPGNGALTAFQLTNQIGYDNPYSNNVLVIQNGQVLKSSNTEYFKLTNSILEYKLATFKSQPYIADPINYKVYLDGIELVYGADYIFDLSVISVKLKERVYKDNSLLAIVDFSNSEYIITNSEIQFTNPPLAGTTEVVTFFNHNVREIRRTEEFTSLEGSIINGSYDYYRYRELAGGKFKLSRSVAIDDYVWIIKNNQMLTHSVDYYVDSDLVTIKLATPLVTSDVLDVICFTDTVVNHSYGYMQFKDMLNRVHYKRISKAKSTRLAKDLRQRDTSIFVVDGTNLSPPNPALNLPGIIEINGERIEYFSKDGNILSQLRRGTLGTGAPEIHKNMTNVLDIGPTETIPYQDRHVVDTIISDGTTRNIPLKFTPQNKDEIDIFVEGYRLKKNSYSLFEESNGHPYSPEGDSSFDAEFSVDGTSNSVVISADVMLNENSKIVVIKKLGKIWNPEGTDLTYVDNDIANFIKNTEAIFSQYVTDKYQYMLSNDPTQ